MIRSFLFAALLAVASAAGLPQLPLDWSAIVIQDVDINQGGVRNPDGSVCCPADAPQCKVQTVFQAGRQYFDYTHNRTSFRSADGSGVVTLYNEGKQFQVTLSGECESYCPLPKDDRQLFPIGFPNDAKDMGTKSYEGHIVHDIHWEVIVPILNISMQYSDFYIDESGKTPIPVAQIDHIAPFGENVGMQNTTWLNFTPGTPDSKYFIVKNMDKCQINPQCAHQQSDDAPPGPGFDDSSDSAYVRRLMAERNAAEGIRIERELGVGLYRIRYN